MPGPMPCPGGRPTLDTLKRAFNGLLCYVAITYLVGYLWGSTIQHARPDMTFEATWRRHAGLSDYRKQQLCA